MTSPSLALRASTNSFNQLIGARGTPFITRRNDSLPNDKSDSGRISQNRENRQYLRTKSAQSEQGRERLVNLCQFRITKRKYAKEEKSAVRFYRNFPLAGLWMVKLDSLPGKLQFVNVQHTRSPLRMFSLSTLPPSARHFAECQGVK